MKFQLGLVAAIAAAGAAMSITVAPAAEAAPRCLFVGDWNCEGPPQYNGPLLPTWNVPGTYGGWTNDPVLCDPIAQTCRIMVPGN